MFLSSKKNTLLPLDGTDGTDGMVGGRGKTHLGWGWGGVEWVGGSWGAGWGGVEWVDGSGGGGGDGNLIINKIFQNATKSN